MQVVDLLHEFDQVRRHQLAKLCKSWVDILVLSSEEFLLGETSILENAVEGL